MIAHYAAFVCEYPTYLSTYHTLSSDEVVLVFFGVGRYDRDMFFCFTDAFTACAGARPAMSARQSTFEVHVGRSHKESRLFMCRARASALVYRHWHWCGHVRLLSSDVIELNIAPTFAGAAIGHVRLWHTHVRATPIYPGARLRSHSRFGHVLYAQGEFDAGIMD